MIWVLAIHDIIPNNLYQNNLEVLINIQVPTFQFGIFKLESQVGDLRITIKKKISRRLFCTVKFENQ